MLHHLSLGALDIDRAARFYDAVLAPLGYVRVWSDLRPGEDEQAVGYGPPGSGDKLCIKQVTVPVPVIPGFHLAFAAESRSAVQAFHAAALAAGGCDNGPAGLRPDYGEHYYAAFVVDPEGHRLEAVCNALEPST
jgi:catechol 2,3-dioxygenase-like lactoylglutathione lyase family enzyme